MNSRLRLQQFKVLFYVHLCTILLLAATGRASASGSGTAANDIKDTNYYPIPSGAFYVAPDGKEGNYGQTPGAPTTIQKAVNRALAGGTIVFRGGIYHNVPKTYISKKLTLQPYPHEKVWIKGSLVVTGWVNEGTIWRKNDWNYSFPPNVNSGFINPNYPMAGYRDMVYIDGVALRQVASIAEVVPGKFYVDSASKRLYIGNNPTNKTVEATAQEQGFVVYASSTSDPSESIIRGLGFAHYAEQGVAVGRPRVTLENNTFVWNGATGAFYAGGVDGIVRGNTFAYNGRKGLGGDRAHRLLVEGNTMSYNNQERFAVNVDAAGVKFIRTNGFIWRNNLVEYNYGPGMWVDGSSSNATIVRNVVHNNTDTGIWFEVSYQAIIGANIVYKNGTGISIMDSSRARVFNNTLANNIRNLRVYDKTRKNTNAAEVAAGITWITRDNIFTNNILSNTTGAELFEAWNCETKEASSLMITSTDYNAYYRTSSSTPQNVIEWSLGPNNCQVTYPTVAAFNSATGYEEHALAIDNVATNPFFIDEEKGDFRLKTGSPAIGRGSSLQAESAAAIGVPPGVKLDLGALQATVY